MYISKILINLLLINNKNVKQKICYLLLSETISLQINIYCNIKKKIDINF